jgi:hypothetical protein
MTNDLLEDQEAMKMKSFLLRNALAAVAALTVTGLAFGQQVTYNYDRGTDFSKFKTYKWVPIEGAQHPNQITAGNITSIIDGILASKGFVKKDADPVDLNVGYGTTIQDQQMITGYGGGFGFRFGGMGMAETQTIQNGTVLVDIYSTAEKLLVWRATGTESLDPSSDPNKNYSRLKTALTKLMKNFPPPKSK